jgi:hypothetical protein
VPLIDDNVRNVGREVRKLARLHGELAQTELQAGLRRSAIGFFLFGIGVTIGGLALAAVGIALYLLLTRWMSAAAAAGLVGAAFVALAAVAYFIAFQLLRGSRSLLLPRTRALLLELLRWQEGPKDS